MLANRGEITPPCGEPVVGYVTVPSSQTPAFSHLPISRRSTPSRTLRLSISRKCVLSKVSKNFRISTSSTQPPPRSIDLRHRSSSATCADRLGRKPYEQL